MSKRKRLLERSYEWIRHHWDAANLDVPDEFLHQWIYVPSENEAKPPGFHLAVFTFGLFQYDLLANRVPPGVKRSFAASEILRLFDAWQMKLALAELHRKTEMKSKALPLFAFPPNECVETWAVPLGTESVNR